MLNLLLPILAALIIIAVAVLLPRRYMMARVDPETIAEALRERLDKQELKLLVMELIAGLD